MKLVATSRGDSPLVLGLPHTGAFIPDDIWDKLNATGRKKSDTDWHIETLYDGLLESVSSVRTLVHRYVIDVNRDPDGQSLYPGKNTTALCPVTDFDAEPIYLEGMAPDAGEILRRKELYHNAYHVALQGELERVRERHGFVILFDCHSIRSKIPYLFEGELPNFSIGTNCGTSCAPEIEAAVVNICSNAEGYSHVTNGRFKGGWTTRHYGEPDQGVHTVQLELAQSTYMLEEPPWTYQVQKAERLRVHLKTILETLSNWRPS